MCHRLTDVAYKEVYHFKALYFEVDHSLAMDWTCKHTISFIVFLKCLFISDLYRYKRVAAQVEVPLTAFQASVTANQELDLYFISVLQTITVSIVETLGTWQSVLYMEVSSFQG